MTPVAPGDVLAGKYRVTKVLGIGGMGVVVAATHIQLDQNVALKFMLPEALGSAEAVARFLREARAAVQLHSEHVARVSDVGTLETGAPYIVMEYLEGTDLAGVLASRGTLRPEEAVEYVLQASDALAEAHSLGIVHRDLKPANLFLTKRRDGTPLVKVLDFGISKASALNEQGAGGLTKTGGIMGSPLYMSPEQMKSAKDADARADIWALGIILYELLGGRPPFDSDTLGALMARVLTEPPPLLASVRPDLPPALCDAIARCLEKDRDRRWPTIAHLATALVPFAPPRARPLVERISIVLGQTAQWIAADAPPSALVPGPPAAVDAHGGTIRGWSETAGGGQAPGGSRKTVPLLVGAVVAFLVVGVIAGGALLAVRHGGAVAAQGAPLAATTPVATAPAPIVASAPAAAPVAVNPPREPEPSPVAPSEPSSVAPLASPASSMRAAHMAKKEALLQPAPQPQPSKKPPVVASAPPAAAAHAPVAPQAGLLDTSN